MNISPTFIHFNLKDVCKYKTDLLAAQKAVDDIETVIDGKTQRITDVSWLEVGGLRCTKASYIRTQIRSFTPVTAKAGDD